MTEAELDRLDIRMATSVMIWHKVAVIGHGTCDDAWADCNDEVVCEVTDWQPTRDIVQAFQCLEKMIADGWNVSLVADNGWGCTLYKVSLYQWYGPINAETPSTAICLTIEKALEEMK